MLKKVWIYNPSKLPKPKVPEIAKIGIKEKCDKFINSQLKMKYVKPFNPKNKRKIQLVDIYSSWHRNYIYFIAAYKNLKPNAIASEYEDKFARLEYVNKNHFRLCYMRHTGQWWDVTYRQGDSLNQCLKAIDEMPHFLPIF